MKSAGDRLEEVLRAAVKSSGGKYRSVRNLVESTGLRDSTYRNFKRRSRENPKVEITTRLARSLAAAIGMKADELIQLVHPPSAQEVVLFPNRLKAAHLAGELGLPETAIDAILAEQAESDPSVWYWFKRIEAEAVRRTPLLGIQPE